MFAIIWIFLLEPPTISVMRVVELNDKTYLGVLYEAVRAVKSGGVIIFPTDTVYGIGGNALDIKVVERIFRIKNRPKDKAMPVLVRDIAMARKLAYIDLWTEDTLAKLWPGPVTAVLHKKDLLPEAISGGKETIALRMPDQRFLFDLMKQIEVPLIATSANISGESNQPKSLTRFLEALADSKYRPDLVIDAGELSHDEPSTILDLTNRKNPAILRKGVMTKAELEKLLVASQSAS